jgi:putative serine protease PepD
MPPPARDAERDPENPDTAVAAPADPSPQQAGSPTLVRHRRGRHVAAVCAAALVGAGAGVLVGWRATAALGDPPPSNSTAVQVESAAARMAPSVVTVDVAGATEGGTGSGIVLRSDGYILTNDHVVSLDGSQSASTTQVTVLESDGTALPAAVVGVDPPDDLAVIKVQASGLHAATFGHSGTLVVGEPVLAIGAPLGLSQTVTSGIVSALNRPVEAGDNGEATFSAVQTDAAINPGNSGGPLVNLSGQVIGVDSALASTSTSSDGTTAQPGSIGIGFAIPADEAVRVAEQLIATGSATHATLGVTVEPALAADPSAPSGAGGATIAAVTPGGPAAQADLQPGDVVTAVGQQRISGQVALVAAVRSYAPGAHVVVHVTRGETPRSVTVILGSTPS